MESAWSNFRARGFWLHDGDDDGDADCEDCACACDYNGCVDDVDVDDCDDCDDCDDDVISDQ